MATVYIIYSKQIDNFYIGSCQNIAQRLEQHKNGLMEKSFTKRATDWEIYLTIPNLEYKQAREIEAHIKRMKSRKYIENLQNYDLMKEKLIERYKSAGSSR